MRQTLEGQLNNNEAPRQKEPAQPGIEQASSSLHQKKPLVKLVFFRYCCV
jgi:hypothetical protein